MKELKIITIIIILSMTSSLTVQFSYEIPAKQLDELFVDVYDSSIKVKGSQRDTILVKILHEKPK